MPVSSDIYNYLMVFFFTVGYLLIIFEHTTGINKATSALLMAVICWVLQFADPAVADWAHLNDHISNVSQIILFLLGALTIVEIIYAHGGLSLVGNLMRTRSKITSLWIIGTTSFFLSSILDNLTTTIVMVMILSKAMKDRHDRLIFGSAVVIAANAGGAWTPIGDVTTTMLWVGGQISTIPTMLTLFLPSFLCCATALACFSFTLKDKRYSSFAQPNEDIKLEPKAKWILILGILSLMFVPIFKTITGLPPFMGILFSMSFMWLITDLFHKKHIERQHLRVPALLSKIDISAILFFLGILLSVDALETAGILKNLALWLDTQIPSKEIITVVIGIVSAIIDNVPLVAACMGMYDLSAYPMDSSFWQLIAFTAGTGGSLLIIGSAAGIAFMGIEKVDFFWYLRKATFPATMGYFIGILTYLLFM